MTQITTSTLGDGEEAWPELIGREAEIVRLVDDENHLYISTIDPDHGLNPDVLIRLDLPDGKTVIARSSMRLLTRITEGIAETYHRRWMSGDLPDQNEGARHRTVHL